MVKSIPSFTEIFLDNDVRVLVVIYGGLNITWMDMDIWRG